MRGPSDLSVGSERVMMGAQFQVAMREAAEPPAPTDMARVMPVGCQHSREQRQLAQVRPDARPEVVALAPHHQIGVPRARPERVREPTRRANNRVNRDGYDTDNAEDRKSTR